MPDSIQKRYVRPLLKLAVLAALSGCGDAEHEPVPAAPVASKGPVRGPAAEAIDLHLRAISSWGYAGNFLLARGGEVLLHRGYGYADRAAARSVDNETVFDIGSVAKVITATAVLRLVDDGALSLADTLGGLLSDVPVDRSGITVRQLLSHSAGLEMYHDFNIWQPWGLSRQAAQRRIMRTPLEYEPGTGYSYSNSGLTLLAMIVERVAAQPYEEYVRERILAPAGMTATDFEGSDRWESEEDAAGYYRNQRQGTALSQPSMDWRLLGAGGMVSNPGDLMRLHEALFNGTLLSDSLAALMLRPVDGEYDPIRFDERALGFRVWREDGRLIAEKGGHTGSGGFSALFRTYRDSDRALIFALNVEDEAYAALHNRLGVKLHRMWKGERQDAPPHGVPVSEEALGGWPDELPLPEGGLIRFAHRGGRLLAAAEGQDGVEWLLESGAEEAARLRAVNQRAAAMLTAGLAGGAVAAAAYALEGDTARIGPLFREGAARYTRFRILGSAPEWVFPTDGTVSFVSLMVEDEPLLRRLHWDERGRLRGVGGAAFEAPAFAFVLPQAGDSVALYNLELGRRVDLARSTLTAAWLEGGGCGPVVQRYIDAYNAHDPEAVAAVVAPDITWSTVANGKADPEVEGADALRRWLVGHFRNQPTTSSRLVSCMAAGDRVTAVEEATWSDDGVPRSATALSIYQVEEGRIRRVWYME